MHEKIESNIYHDERCKKYPYYVNIMRRGHSFYKKFASLEEAREAKAEFINKHSTHSTDHPLVFIRGNVYILEVMVEKTYTDFEEACKKADILQRFIDS